MATLRKSDMSARVAAALGGSKAQGEAALNAVMDSIQEALAAGTGWFSRGSAPLRSGR